MGVHTTTPITTASTTNSRDLNVETFDDVPSNGGTLHDQLETFVSHFTLNDFDDPGEAVKYFDRSAALENPFLKTRRETKQKEMCHIWTSNSVNDLCSRGKWARLRLMRELSLFSKDCSSTDANVQLGEMFRLEWQSIKSESDLLAHTEQLKKGVEGRDCILGAPRSTQCLACFQRINTGLEQLERAYQAFARTLQRFDCMLAVDSSTATRPFSPNGTCQDCKTWYRKWLLVQLVNIWEDPVCINWCYYTQLACPHFATSRVVDFAGHPAFQCRDLHIPQTHSGKTKESDGATNCRCIHPCDFQRPIYLNSETVEDSPNKPLYDFYASPKHCWRRQKRCGASIFSNKNTEHESWPRHGATRLKSVDVSERGKREFNEQSNERRDTAFKPSSLTSTEQTSNILNIKESIELQQSKNQIHLKHQSRNQESVKLSGASKNEEDSTIKQHRKRHRTEDSTDFIDISNKQFSSKDTSNCLSYKIVSLVAIIQSFLYLL